MAIKLVAVDLDGTLLNSNKDVSAASAEAIRHAIDSGVQVALGTGRGIAECCDVIAAVPKLRYLVCCTGAVVYDRTAGQTLASCLLPAEDAKLLYRKLKDFDCIISFFTGGQVYNPLDRMQNFNHYYPEPVRSLFDRTHTVLEDLDGFVEDLTQPAEKFYIAFADQAECVRAYETVKDLPFFITNAGYVDFEIMHKDADKGTGLRALAEHLGLRREEVLAIGDSSNDRQMLEYAGTAVVMANGSDDMKQIADLIAPSNDADGVAWVLNRILEGKL